MGKEIGFEATEITEYLNGSLQTSGYIRMGTQYSGSGTSYWYHDVVIVLDIPRTLEKLTVVQKWRGHEAGTTNYAFSAALTQEERTTAPEEAELSYTFSGTQEATLTFAKKLKKGRWYLWLWRHNRNAPSFVYGGRNTYPVLTITGEAKAAGHIYRDGEWKDTVPKVYRNGSWQDAAPKEYKGEWGELT